VAKGSGGPGRWIDATDGYSTVGKKVSEQDAVTIMAAREGSNPSLSTIVDAFFDILTNRRN